LKKAIFPSQKKRKTTVLAIVSPTIAVTIPINTTKPSWYSIPRDIIKIAAHGIAFPKRIGRATDIEHKNANTAIIFSEDFDKNLLFLGLKNLESLLKKGSALVTKLLKVSVLIFLFAMKFGNFGLSCPSINCMVRMHKGMPNKVVNPGGVGTGIAIGNAITAIINIMP